MERELVAPGVWWVPSRPGRSFARSHAYIVESPRMVVEPACEGDEVTWWVETLRALGCPPIVLTHHHIDHTFGVELLQEETGCEVWAPPRGAPTKFTPHQQYEVTRELREGDVLGEWRVLRTPGHEHEHVCLFDGRTLISGDATAVGLGWPHEFRESLRRLVALAPETVLPGHNLPALYGSFGAWGRRILDEDPPLGTPP